MADETLGSVENFFNYVLAVWQKMMVNGQPAWDDRTISGLAELMTYEGRTDITGAPEMTQTLLNIRDDIWNNPILLHRSGALYFYEKVLVSLAEQGEEPPDETSLDSMAEFFSQFGPDDYSKVRETLTKSVSEIFKNV